MTRVPAIDAEPAQYWTFDVGGDSRFVFGWGQSAKHENERNNGRHGCCPTVSHGFFLAAK